MAGSASSSRWPDGLTPYLLYLVLIATLGPLQFGYHLAELNTPEKAIRCTGASSPAHDDAPTSLPSCLSMTSTEFAVVTALFTLGGLLGALSCGPLASAKGRLLAMRFTAPLFILGSILEATAPHAAALAVGRLLAGIGAGAATVVVPIFISEIAPKAAKGALGASTQIMINVGILVTQTLGHFLGHGSLWRVVLAVGAALGVAQLLGLAFAIESPEWLGTKGRMSDAKKNLRRIRGGALSDDEADRWTSRAGEEDEYQNLISHDRPGSGNAESISRGSGQSKQTDPVGILAVVKSPQTRPAVIAVVTVMLAQQFTGINSVIMYSVSFLSPLLPTGASLLTVAVGALNLFVTIACSPLPDKIGRKTCLLLSIAGMGTMSLLLALGLVLKIDIMVGICTLLFVACFAVGLGPVPFILASELVGPEAVGATQSWALGSSWIATFIVAQFFPIVNEALGGKVFFVFVGTSIFFFLFIAAWLPESKGKKDADEVWGRERRIE